MATLKEIKKRINGVTNTMKITNAMYLTSSAKFASAKEQYKRLMPRFDALDKEMDAAVSCLKDNEFTTGKKGKTLYLLVACEKGLAGDFPKETVKYFCNLDKDEDYELLILGNAAKKVCKAKKIIFNEEFDFELKKPDYTAAKKISDYLVNRFKNENTAKVIIIFNDFVHSVASVTEKQYLPLVKAEKAKTDFAFYPDRETVCNGIISAYLVGFIHRVILSSYCGEQNARMMAMDSANKNGRELLDELNIQYNHRRQNSITSEIAEISSGLRKEQ